MGKILKYILIIIAITVCVGFAAYATMMGNRTSDSKVCSKINISINDFMQKKLISDKEIAQLLQNDDLNPIGKSIEKIKTKKIEDAIEKHPMVRHAECYKTPNGEIQVIIEQRTPVLRIVGGENYYVDDLRKTMPISLNFAVYVPVATGRVTKKIASGELFDFAQYINKDEFWNNQIVQININEKMQVELITRIGDQVIVLGNFDRFQQKLDKLKKLYLYALNERGWNEYSRIDLQYKDEVICTKRTKNKIEIKTENKIPQ